MLKENSSLAGRSFFEGENVQEQPLAYTAVRAAPTVFPAEKFLTVSVKSKFVEFFSAGGSDAPTTTQIETCRPRRIVDLLRQKRTEGVQGRAESPLPASVKVKFTNNFSCRGLTRRLRRGSGTCRPMGRSHFSFDGERKVCKRKPAARRLRRRPTSLCTAAKPCAALGLGYALHGFQPFLALVGLRPPLAVGFGLQ